MNNISILLVDDDADLTEYWASQLGRTFSCIHRADHAFKALEVLHRERPDVVVAATGLPGMDGFSLCQEISRDTSLQTVSVILYKTGYISREDRHLAAEAGAEHLIPKPASITEVSRLVQESYTENRVGRIVDARVEATRDVSVEEAYGDALTRRLGETIHQLKNEQRASGTALSRYKDFTRCLADFLWETDAQMCITFLEAAPDNRLDLPVANFDDKRFTRYFSTCFSEDGLEEFEHLSRLRQSFDITCELNKETDLRIVRLSARPWFSDEGGFSGFRGVIVDVTETQLNSEKLYFAAHHDALTGLLNARAFDSALKNEIVLLHQAEQHVLCYLDLDFFKEVNDTAGHRAGDALLVQLSDLLRSKVRSNDILARIGGDEFSILMRHCSLDQARRLIQDLHNSIKTFRFFWENRCYEIGLSIGLLEITSGHLGVREVMDMADQACYAAKNSGRNQIQVYGDVQTTGKLAGDALWLEKFHRAVKDDKLCLFQQPMRRQRGHGRAAFEILVRLRDGEKLVSPKYFLSVIERYQLATILDLWVINKVIDWLENDIQPLSAGEFYSVNITTDSLCDTEFRQHVHSRLKNNIHVAEKICFEVTESSAMENLANAIEFISDLRALGCRFALDDFGTGFSSLAHLKNLPVDFVKLDGMFIKGVTSDPVDFGLVQSIQNIAGMMNIKTIAEYVETPETATRLSEIGVDYLQGFYIGHPEMIRFNTAQRQQASLV